MRLERVILIPAMLFHGRKSSHPPSPTRHGVTTRGFRQDKLFPFADAG